MRFSSPFVFGRMPRVTAIRQIVALIAPLCVASSAHAKRGHSDGEQPTETLPSQAKRACISGDYEKGVSILTELFIRTNKPEWVYNQGRCLEQNARYEEAILRFEEYLRLTKNSAGQNKASRDAEEHIAECRSKLPRTEPIAPPPTQPATIPPPIVVAQEPAPPKELVQAQVQAEPEQARTGLRVAGIVAGVLGAASLATAVIFNLKANRLADDLTEPEGYERDKASQRKTDETLSWIGYGMGAACLTTSAILLYLGYRSDDSSRVALTPALAPGQAGLSVQGVF